MGQSSPHYAFRRNGPQAGKHLIRPSTIWSLSFAWVLLYELLHWAPSRTQSETRWWKLLNADGVSHMPVLKRSILYEWQVEGPKLSPYLSCCEKLLEKWFNSVQSWSKKCQNLMDTGVALDSEELMGLLGVQRVHWDCRYSDSSHANSVSSQTKFALVCTMRYISLSSCPSLSIRGDLINRLSLCPSYIPACVRACKWALP